jgi:hypothetical protein
MATTKRPRKTSKTARRKAKTRKPQISAAAASAALKRYATKQQVEVELTEEQMQALKRQLGPGTPGPLDPRRPFNIKFVIKDRPKPFGDFNVASCAYWSDTCCA